jgi:hypothetical protein
MFLAPLSRMCNPRLIASLIIDTLASLETRSGAIAAIRESRSAREIRERWSRSAPAPLRVNGLIPVVGFACTCCNDSAPATVSDGTGVTLAGSAT